MKKLLIWSLALLFSVAAYSQNVLYEDSFESYPTGSYIGEENPDWWTTWSGATGGTEDAMIVEDFAHSGDKSILIDESATHTGQTDLLWLLGDKISGAYEANWYMYIPTGQTGYYNFQHFETPGTEWAIQVHFLIDGTGNLFAGAADPYIFSFDHDTWIHLRHVINIDEDVAELWIDGVLFHTWQWSIQSFGDPGTNQLGGVDFFAGANSPDVDFYYVDDVEYIETVAATDPIIETSPLFFNVGGTSGEVEERTLTIGNIGYGDLEWHVFPIYDVDARGGDVTISATPTYNVKSVSLGVGPSADPDARPGATAPPTDDEVIRYDDGTYYTAIGWNTAPITVRVGARFPAGYITEYAGMELTSVEFYINDQSENYFLRIYGHGSSIAPGDLLHIQAFNPTPYAWNTVVLTDPIIITGEDLWITYQFDQTDLVYTPGCDDGPQNPNGDYVSTGVGWGHLGAVGDPPIYPNWNLAGHLSGTAIPQWLNFSDNSGTLAPGEETDVTVYFDASLLPEGIYSGKVLVQSNDPVTPQKWIPSAFNVAASALAPPTNLEAYTDCQDVVLTWDEPGGGGGPVTEELIYDSGTPTGAYSYVGYTMSTHMSPQEACKLLEVKYYTTTTVGGDLGFNCHLFEWEGAQPGTDIVFTEEGLQGVDEDWVALDLSSENITFDGDFVVGFGSISADVYLGYDEALNNGRSWDFDNTGLAWASWTEAYFIRATVEYPDGSREVLGTIPPASKKVNLMGDALSARSAAGTVNNVDPIQNRAIAIVLEGYNVYRDDVLQNAAPIEETEYIDEALAPGTYSYIVKAVYDEGMSLPVGPVEATVGSIDPINNLVLENEEGTPDVYLTWLPPGEVPQWIRWDDGANFDAIGLNSGGTFDVAARFDTDFLADFAGMSVTQFAYFPRGIITSYAIKIWVGTTLVLEQPHLPNLVEWNYVDLDVPVYIDGTAELWIGYACIDQPTGEWPAGCDNGPAEAGYGDMISMSGGAWQSMSALGFDLNWNIAGYVEWLDAPNKSLRPLNETAFSNPAGTMPVNGQMNQAINASFNAPTRELMGFNVWRNGDLLTASPISETSYADMGVANGAYEYCVTANYGTGCESDPICDNVDITVGINEPDNSQISVYPNPAHGYINIETTVQIKSIKVMNYTGQTIFTNSTVKANEVTTINTSSFEAGIYFIMVETNDGTISKKITIQ
jgi:hypothetical protein